MDTKRPFMTRGYRSLPLRQHRSRAPCSKGLIIKKGPCCCYHCIWQRTLFLIICLCHKHRQNPIKLISDVKLDTRDPFTIYSVVCSFWVCSVQCSISSVQWAVCSDMKSADPWLATLFTLHCSTWGDGWGVELQWVVWSVNSVVCSAVQYRGR